MNFISMSEAMAITKHRTESGFRSYIRRVNMALPPQNRIVLSRRMIERQSLETAVRAYHTRRAGE